jgi:carboxyl-terminal processing protease
MAGSKLRSWTSLPVTCLIALVGVIALQSLAKAQESPKPASHDSLTISREDRLKVFEKLWETVNEKYFDAQFNGVNWAQMKEKYRPQAEAAKNKTQLRDVLQNMLNELHSSHLRVNLHVKLDERIRQDLSREGSRKGHFLLDAGLNFTRVEGRLAVSLIADGSGAQLAGVQRGWILTHWNGQPFDNGLYTCDLGEKVSLRFIDLQGQERDLEVVCKFHPVPQHRPERSTRVLDGGALYLRFSEFPPGTNDWLADQVARNSSAPAIIIDLRGNGGGRLSVLRKCFEPFFSEPAVFGEYRERNGKELTLKVAGRGKSAYCGRVFVLIDETSASAAEIFAAGLQESGRGVVIGCPSSGAVLGNINYDLPDGFKVSVPIRDYRTAKGIRLEGRGVLPDEPVNLTMRDFVENRDPDLERVRELLQKKLETSQTD